MDSVLLNSNIQMLEIHKQVSQLTNTDIDTVIIYKGDELSLWKKKWDTYCEVEKIIPTADQRYTRLKQISHIPVSMAILLYQLMIQPDQREHTLDVLQTKGEEVELIEHSLVEILHAEDIEYQKIILAQTKNTLRNIALLEQPVSVTRLQEMKCAYYESIRQALAYNKKIVTEVQHSVLEQLMQRWQAVHDIIPENCRIIIVSPYGPKVGRIETQYFTRWLQEQLNVQDVLNNWLYSMDELPSKIGTLDCKKDLIEEFLHGAELNKILGEDIEGNRHALFEDILAPYGEDSLNKIYETSKIARLSQE